MQRSTRFLIKMAEKVDLYRQEARLTNALAQLETRSDISPGNREAIKKLIAYNKTKGNGLARQIKYFYYSITLSKLLKKNFTEATKEDLKALLERIQDSKAEDGTPQFKGETVRDMRIALKMMYFSLLDIKDDDEPPAIVSWIKAGKRNNRNVPRSAILEESDIRAMVQASTDARERLFVSLLFFTRARITELMSLRLKHIRQDGGMLKVQLTNFKTNGEHRTVPVGDPETILLYDEYLKLHPDRTNDDALLWQSGGKKGSYHAFNNALKRLAHLAGITKPINFHHFRHSGFTLWGEQGFTEQELVYLGGWASSDMVKTYVSRSERLVESRFAQLYGQEYNAVDKEIERRTKGVLSKAMQDHDFVMDFWGLLAKHKFDKPLLAIKADARKAGRLSATNNLPKTGMPLVKHSQTGKKQVAQPRKEA